MHTIFKIVQCVSRPFLMLMMLNNPFQTVPGDDKVEINFLPQSRDEQAVNGGHEAKVESLHENSEVLEVGRDEADGRKERDEEEERVQRVRDEEVELSNHGLSVRPVPVSRHLLRQDGQAVVVKVEVAEHLEVAAQLGGVQEHAEGEHGHRDPTSGGGNVLIVVDPRCDVVLDDIL